MAGRRAPANPNAAVSPVARSDLNEAVNAYSVAEIIAVREVDFGSKINRLSPNKPSHLFIVPSERISDPRRSVPSKIEFVE
jgi:hypothetical protein